MCIRDRVQAVQSGDHRQTAHQLGDNAELQQIMGLDLLQQLPGPALCLTLHNGVEADALAVGALLDDLLQPVEGAAADEQNEMCIRDRL